ncbi:type II toxin-antitoxin system HicB family antitoxin [bacterium]|nr:type II toxin-antitoxin system HicB family antitoxin [bacterium]
MKELNYIVWREDDCYISQCLNVEVASFGKTIEEAIKNLVEAVELYLEDEKIEFQNIEDVLVGSKRLPISLPNA